MTSPTPQWAVLRIHDEAHDGATGEPPMVVPVADKAHGPYATERAALMVTRGLNDGILPAEGLGVPRYIPVLVTPVYRWTWDGPAEPIQMGGSIDCVSQPGPGQIAAPVCALKASRTAVTCSDTDLKWQVHNYIGKGAKRQDRGVTGPVCYSHAAHEENWTHNVRAIQYGLAERIPGAVDDQPA